MTFGICVGLYDRLGLLKLQLNIVYQIWSDKVISNLYSEVFRFGLVFSVVSHPSNVSVFTVKQNISGCFCTHSKYD